MRKIHEIGPSAASLDHQGRVIDLLVGDVTVSLHLYFERSRLCSANRLVRLPIDPALGGADPNFRLLRVLKDAGQAELDRQDRERHGRRRPGRRVTPPEAVDLGDLARFPAPGARAPEADATPRSWPEEPAA